MATTSPLGSISALWRFPVKSMAGERIESAHVTEHGVLGDRAYALIDRETGKVVSAKSVKLFPDLLECKAKFVEPPSPNHALPAVRIVLPDGTALSGDSADIDAALSSHFGRGVTLAGAAPDDYTIDHYHPDIENVDPRGHRDTFVEQKLGAALFAEIGADSPVPAGSFFDVFPLTVMTTSTLRRLGELRPESLFDERRFRMNVIIETEQDGFIENDWVGRDLALGESRVHAAKSDARCVMTTLAQGDLPHDTEILRTLVRHNSVTGATGGAPCAGVYAVVLEPGTVRIGDAVAFA